MNTKQPSPSVLCDNIILFGVAEDHIHPAGSCDPAPPETQ